MSEIAFGLCVWLLYYSDEDLDLIYQKPAATHAQFHKAAFGKRNRGQLQLLVKTLSNVQMIVMVWFTVA